MSANQEQTGADTTLIRLGDRFRDRDGIEWTVTRVVTNRRVLTHRASYGERVINTNTRIMGLELRHGLLTRVSSSNKGACNQ